MRALVTGGAGFLGSALVDRLLAEGHTVEVVDDLSTGALANLAEARAGGAPLRFTKLDVTSPDLAALVAHRPPDVVYHLACPPGAAASVDDPIADARAVVLSALAVLEAARRGGAGKVVVALSAAVYGEPEALPVKESHPYRPVVPRGVAEAAVAGYLAHHREQHSLEGTALVLGTVYGPRQRPGAIAADVTGWADRLLAGDPVRLPGDGADGHDLLFVDDAVDALARSGERGGGLVLNVGTGRSTTLRDLAGAVAAQAGADPPHSGGPAPAGAVVRMALDASRARLHLGWASFTPLADGVAATVAACRRGA
ncbi:MAG TPA: NAD-dependent epimerase/dehydratase family protein [Acidimicrobiales bacterium]|nr:NAD-dependent epimerase/dehydratase family protein [Acidimicrobiales bacterium]